MEELKLERISDETILKTIEPRIIVGTDNWNTTISLLDAQLQADQQVVDKLKAEITSKDKGIELLNASIKCFESAIEEYKQEKKEIFTTTKSIICGLCYRLNPQHKDMDYGKGCKHCKEIDDIERKLNI
jgi:chromosome segregation ATPase